MWKGGGKKGGKEQKGYTRRLKAYMSIVIKLKKLQGGKGKERGKKKRGKKKKRGMTSFSGLYSIDHDSISPFY